MSRLCVYIAPDERDLLDKLSAAMERSPSWILRMLLRTYANRLLVDYKRALPSDLKEVD